MTIAAAYGQLHDFQFVNFDDPDYVVENPHVHSGDVAWAFTSTEHANWFPITWLSHMLDIELYGLRAGPHHLTSVAIHALSTLLLFGLLRKTTGDRWPSAFVALVFAVHPLHVESVAWISERKDVLCAFFFILTLWAYVHYVDRPGALRYSIILVPFACGIMSKPMIVTLPFVLLLMDVWPLHRLVTEGCRRKNASFRRSPRALRCLPTSCSNTEERFPRSPSACAWRTPRCRT